MAQESIQATGRRKTAVARIHLFRGGEGKIEVNGFSYEEYFPTEAQRLDINRPLVITELSKDVSIKCRVDGGGKNGQAGALRHAISRALIKLDPSHRAKLKPEGMLTRDPRMKERKKYGQAGARKRFQFSKR